MMQGRIPLSFNASLNQSALSGSPEPVALTGSMAAVGPAATLPSANCREELLPACNR
jgi:hypothetical protein